MRKTPIQRWAAKVKLGAATECWPWTGYRSESGYGHFTLHGRHVSASRAAYLLLVGDIPPGWHVDHLCRNRICVNPAHLEAVTPAENARRGLAGPLAVLHYARQTHCKAGHEFIVVGKVRDSHGFKHCAECYRQMKQRSNETRRKSRRSRAKAELIKSAASRTPEVRRRIAQNAAAALWAKRRALAPTGSEARGDG